MFHINGDQAPSGESISTGLTGTGCGSVSSERRLFRHSNTAAITDATNAAAEKYRSLWVHTSYKLVNKGKYILIMGIWIRIEMQPWNVQFICIWMLALNICICIRMFAQSNTFQCRVIVHHMKQTFTEERVIWNTNKEVILSYRDTVLSWSPCHSFKQSAVEAYSLLHTSIHHILKYANVSIIHTRTNRLINTTMPAFIDIWKP